MSVIFKIFIFPKNETKMKIKTNKTIFLFLEVARQGLTLLLRISIRNEKSGLRSSLDKIVCQVDIFICDIFVINFFIFDIKMIYFQSFILNIA